MRSLLERLLVRLAACDRRLDSWRRRAALALLRAEHPALRLPASVWVEPDVLWRLDRAARVDVGAGSRLRRGCELKADRGAQVTIGRNVHLGPGTTISALADVRIGDDCLIAERVSIRDHDHGLAVPPGLDLDAPYHARGYVAAPVVLGKNVWLGGGVTIVKGVTLGDNCVVGANAVVTKSFPANCVIAGVPARIVRMLAPLEAPIAA